jgi:tetratricopeptide (TPR) repeat protein
VLALPIWFFFANGLWFLGVGGIIGVVIAVAQDMDKSRKKLQQEIAQSAITETRRSHAEAEQDSTAHDLEPIHRDVAAFADAAARALKDVDALNPWLDHSELGQAAKLLRGALLMAADRSAEALGCFEAVLGEPPSATSEEFLGRCPMPVSFQAAGVGTKMHLSRSAAAIYAAMIYQTRGDSEHAMEAIEHAGDSDLATTLKSTYAFNLDRFDDVLRITRWVPRPAETPLEAFGLILRGCALREKGQPADALKVFDDAAAAAAKVPEVANRLTFEVGRTLARQGNDAEARRKYIQVHKADPHFPELEEALAALPPT